MGINASPNDPFYKDKEEAMSENRQLQSNDFMSAFGLDRFSQRPTGLSTAGATPDVPAAAPADASSGFMEAFGLDRFAKKPAEPAPAQPQESDGFFSSVGRGLKSGGIDSAKDMAVGGAALLADTVGADETATSLYGKYKENQAEAQKEAKPYESFSNVMSGQADFSDFFGYWGGYAVGQAAQTVATGLAGAAIGSALPGAGTVGGAISGMFARGAVQTGLKKMVANKVEGIVAAEVAKNAAKGIALDVAEKMAYETAAKTVMKSAGAAAAVYGQNLMMEGASIYGDAREGAEKRGEETDLSRVWTASVGAATVDTLMDLIGLKGMTKALGGGNVIKNVAIESFKGGLREAPTEAIQTGFERWGAGKDLATSEAIRDYIDSAAAGAVGGVLFGTAKGTVKSVRGGEEERKLSMDEVRSMFTEKMQSDDGRMEIWDAMQQDHAVARALQSAGIESHEDPRFDGVVTQALQVKEMLASVEPPSAEQQAATRKERGADVAAAFGETASTSVGVGTGANQPVLQRNSVTPNLETKTLEGDAQPVVLNGNGVQGNTIAMSGEDIVANQQGWTPMPAMTIGETQIGNQYKDQKKAAATLTALTQGYNAENLLTSGILSKKQTKETLAVLNEARALFDLEPVTSLGKGGERVFPNMGGIELNIRQGQRSKEAGGGKFFFVEQRPKVSEQAASAAAPAATPAPAPAEPASPALVVAETPAPAAPVQPAEPTPAVTVATTAKGKDKYDNPVTDVTMSDGAVVQIARLNSTESMGLPGWHDVSKFGPTDGGFLGNTKEEALKELERRANESKKAAPAASKPAPAPAPTPAPARSKADIKASAIESWENNDDGSAPHVPFKSLSKEAQADWIEAHAPEDGEKPYDSAELHDKMVSTHQNNQRKDKHAGKGKDEPLFKQKEPAVRTEPITDAKTVDDLNRVIQAMLDREGNGETFAARRVPVGNLAGKLPGIGLIERMAAAFGKPVVFFEVAPGSADFFDGVVLRGDKTIFVNVNTTVPHLRIFGHELVHSLRNSDPKTYQRFVDAVAPFLSDSGFAAYTAKQNKQGVKNSDKVLEEAVGDLLGDRFGETEFWREVAEQNPTMFKAFAKFVTDFINGLTIKLRRANLKSDTLVTDLEQVRSRLASVIADMEMAPEAEVALKATPAEKAEAKSFNKENGIMPYTSAGQIEVDLDEDAAFSIKPQYGEKDIAAGRMNHPTLGLPLNKNGTVTLYYPTTNEDARRVTKERTLKGAQGTNRVYLTNESNAGKVLSKPGMIQQEVGGANVLVQIDPSYLQLAEEHADGRKDFFIPIAEGDVFRKKMQTVRLFTQNAPRNKGLHADRTMRQIADGVNKGVDDYLSMDAAGRKARLAQAKETLMREHNVTTLLGVNGKLEKTNLKGYENLMDKLEQDVISMGLGMASAQKINDTQKLTTCPQSAICESLCLGETSGQNLLYGGDGQFRSGPRLSQYLKTEALVVHPEDFAIVLHSEIAKFAKMAKSKDAKASVRLNVTTDFNPNTFESLIKAFPEVMFYDYTKLDTRPIAANHHLTYSSTGASQVVDGKVVFNQQSNWDRMVRAMNEGRNVAMAFTSRTDMPKFVVDQKTGKQFTVWNGDLYDARFLDPKQDSGDGMIIGLTNKDRTTDPKQAAKVHNGFFLNYDPAEDGDTLVILDQSKLTENQNGLKPQKTIPISVSVAEDVAAFSRKDQTAESLGGDDTPAFKTWFGKSKIKFESGVPEIWYHGTAQDVSIFRAKQAGAIFVTPNPRFAEGFANASEEWMQRHFDQVLTDEQIETARSKAEDMIRFDYGRSKEAKSLIAEVRDSARPSGEAGDYFMRAVADLMPSMGNIMPVYVRAENPFDFQNSAHLDKIEPIFKRIANGSLPRNALSEGLWSVIEDRDVQGAIKEAGFDAFYVIEGGVKNLAVYEPNQLKSVFNNGGWSTENDHVSFSRKQYTDQYADLPDDVRDTAIRIGHYTAPTIKERLKALTPNMRERVVQGVFDHFRAIKKVGNDLYMKARLANGKQDGAVSALVHTGHVFNDGGALNVVKGTKGLVQIMEPLGNEVERFLLWMAAGRANNLSAQGKEKFMSPEDIKRLRRLGEGTMSNGKPRIALYAQVQREMNDLNRSVLNVALNSGLIGQDAYKIFSEDVWYVPFYRHMEDNTSDGLSAAQSSAKLVNQQFSKSIKGSTKQLNDLLENVLMNWGHILSASMKNSAANEILQSAEKLGGAEQIKSSRKGSVRVMVKGQEQHYAVNDPLLLDSLTIMSTVKADGLFTKVASKFKTAFTTMVSVSPRFKIDMLIADSIQALAVSDLKLNPIANAYNGFMKYKTDRSAAEAAGVFFSSRGGDHEASTLKRLAREAGGHAVFVDSSSEFQDGVMKIWDKYEEWSDRMENAQRMSLYDQMIAKGKTHMEAAFLAKDLQDFSLHGSFTAIQWLSKVVPYFNARLQGLYKLGRGAQENPQRFAIVTGATIAASLALFLSQKDDDEWKKREDWDRDMYWWLKIGNYAFRIRKPFEIGALASGIERVTEQMVDKSVEGKVLGRRLYSILWDNLSFNPMPQIFKPAYEVASNKNSFTDRPIDAALNFINPPSAENRYNSSTSAAAMMLGKANAALANYASKVTGNTLRAESMKLSPVQYDHLLRGYLGWLGTVIQTASNETHNLFSENKRPERRVDDYFVIGSYVKSLPATQSKWVTNFYENAAELATAQADLNLYIKNGESAKALELLKRDGGKLEIMAKAYASAKRDISDINKQIKLVTDSKTLTPEVKRARIDRLHLMVEQRAKSMEEARIRLQQKK